MADHAAGQPEHALRNQGTEPEPVAGPSRTAERGGPRGPAGSTGGTAHRVAHPCFVGQGVGLQAAAEVRLSGSRTDGSAVRLSTALLRTRAM